LYWLIFFTQVIGGLFFVIDGLTAGVATGNPKMVIGFVLYGLLSVLILLFSFGSFRFGSCFRTKRSLPSFDV
jgi:hypothetical protein